MTRSVSSATTLIRGGQTTQHWWRMGAQVAKFAGVVGAFIYVATFLYLVLSVYDADEMRIAFFYELAERGVIGKNGFNRPYTFHDLSGSIVTMHAEDLYRDATYRSIRDGFFERVFVSSRISTIPAFIAGLLSIAVFVRAGNSVQDNEFVRGTKLVTATQLKKWSKARWKKYNAKHKGRKKAKPLTVAGIPFPPNTVEAQTCLYGTVGVGKTNAMSEMLATIRQNGGKAIIYDRMGTFVSRFYDEETDFIINPFDDRSMSWNPFDDVLDAASFTQMAEVMIPEHKGAASDPFWSQSARIVFDYAARELYANGPRTIAALINYIIQCDSKKLAGLISKTPGGHFFNEDIEKTAQSIRANLIAELRFLEFLRDDADPFSVRDWIGDDKPSFLFLTGDSEHAAATRNIISTIFDIAGNALMSLGQASEPRCYFFMDEVPSLNRLPFLVSSLAEMRQFGGCFVLGYQVYSQLEDIYGREAAQSIAGTTNNRLVFNTPDFRTAKLCSDTLGQTEEWEANQNISVGAHEARDGVGFSHQRVERSVVSAAEIQNLPQFKAFVKFAYDAPTAPVSMKLFETETRAQAFLPYLGNAFGTAFSKGDESNDAEDGNVEELLATFHEWCSWNFRTDNPKFDGLTEPHPKYAIYFDHFKEAYVAGTAPEDIKPIVVSTEGMVKTQGPCDSQRVAKQPRTHASAPIRLGIGLSPIEPPVPQNTNPEPDTRLVSTDDLNLENPAPLAQLDLDEAGYTAWLDQAPTADTANGHTLLPEPEQASLDLGDGWQPRSKWEG